MPMRMMPRKNILICFHCIVGSCHVYQRYLQTRRLKPIVNTQPSLIYTYVDYMIDIKEGTHIMFNTTNLVGRMCQEKIWIGILYSYFRTAARAYMIAPSDRSSILVSLWFIIRYKRWFDI